MRGYVHGHYDYWMGLLDKHFPAGRCRGGHIFSRGVAFRSDGSFFLLINSSCFSGSMKSGSNYCETSFWILSGGLASFWFWVRRIVVVFGLVLFCF